MADKVEDGQAERAGERNPLISVRVGKGPCGYGFARVMGLACFAHVGAAYDMSCISGAILLIKQNLGLSSKRAGYVVGSSTGAAMLGTIIGGWLADRLGRKLSLILGCSLMTVGALLTAFAQNVPMVFAGRLFSGFSCGFTCVVVDTYIMEVAPSERRGSVVTSMGVFGGCGVIFGFLMNYLLLGIDNDWRIMISIGAIFPVVCLLILLFGSIPESPRYLTMCGRNREALEALEMIVGLEAAEKSMQEAAEAKSAPKEPSWAEVLCSSLHSRRRALMVATGLGTAGGCTGLSVLSIYISWIVAKEYGTQKAFLFALLAAISALAMQCIVMVFFVDSFNRRTLILTGMVGVSCGMAFLTVTIGLELSFMPWLFLGYTLFTTSNSVSGGACGAVSMEVWDVASRAKGMAAARIPGMALTVVVLSFYPTIQAWIGLGALLVIFWINGLVMLLFIYFFVPETRTVSLERMEEVFA